MFLPLIFSLILTTLLTILAIKIFPKIGLLDQPKKYGLKRAPIPYFGGLVIFVSFVVATFIFLPLSTEIIGLLIGASLITAVSFYDDLKGLPPIFRLAVQIFAAGILIFSGVGIQGISNPFGGVINLNFLGLAKIFTICWIVILMNSLNWLDGVPGLSSGITGLAALALFFLAVRPNFHFFDQTAVISLAAILAGAAISFTFFNFSQPKILLGDTGSMLLGFILASLAIFSGGKIATAALVLGVPLLDAIFVVLRRLKEKRSPLTGDLGHLHHRLLAIGFSKRMVVLIFYAMAIIFGSVAIFIPSSFGKFIAFIILLLGFSMVIFFLRGKRLKREV
jgi:UDP-GlcNAc:undecaprenyl-phosphate/decaprenyl-phosphate GlcNAc-1-phosphate transferase